MAERDDNCPRCGAATPLGATECASCGVILAKARGAGARAPTPRAAGDAEVAGPEGIGRDGWRALAIGGALALVLPLFPFLNFVLTPLITIIHELGHTVANWGFGYPAYPAFDFSHGGGVTVSQLQRSSWIVALWFAGLAWLAYRWRARMPLMATAVGVGLVYAGLLVSVRADRALIAVSGHAFELSLAALFLYRGAAGSNCRGGERVAYAFVGLWIAFYDVAFAWGIANHAYTRALYEEGKRGMDPDLVVTGRYVRASLARVAGALTVASLSTPVIALFLAQRHAKLQVRWERLREIL